MTTNIRPLGDRVLVQLLPAEEMTKAGIIIPDTAKDQSQQAKVVAVGPGKINDGTRQPMDVSEGQTVLIGKYGGDEFKYEGEEYKIVSQDDILAIIG